MANKRFEGKAKKTHKMSRDGLIETNAVTGEESKVSQRGQDFALKTDKPEKTAFIQNDTTTSRDRKQGKPSVESQRTENIPPDHIAEKSVNEISVQEDVANRHDVSGNQNMAFSEPDSDIPEFYQRSRQSSGRYDWIMEKPNSKNATKRQQQSYHLAEKTQEFNLSSEQSNNKSDGINVDPLQAQKTGNPKLQQHHGRLRLDASRRIDDKSSMKKWRGKFNPRRFLEKENTDSADNGNQSVDSTLKMEQPRLLEHTDRLQMDGKFHDLTEDQVQQNAILGTDPEKKEYSLKSETAKTKTKQKKQPRLQFASDESSPKDQTQKQSKDGKLEKTLHNLEKATKKSEQAQAALPKKKQIKFEKEFDPESGKMKRKFHFEEKTKSVNEHVKGSLPSRPIKFVGNQMLNFAHKKISEEEKNNVGVEAAHKGEKLLESGLRKAYKMHRTSPYRKAARLQQKTAKLEAKAAYQKVLNENPKMKSNLFSRMAQKRKIKKEYAQTIRAAKNTGNKVKRAAVASKKAGAKLVNLIKTNPKVLLVAAALVLLIIIISSIVSSCSTVMNGAITGITMSSYTAPDADINQAELLYQQWELELQLKIENAENDHQGYDEYRYQIDDISHDPYELIAFLTSVYGTYDFENVQGVLRELFDEQYQLTFTPTTETRYRTVTDPATGQVTSVPYPWNILNVRLKSKSFSEVISGRMNPDQNKVYEVLMETMGNRQYLVNPFDFDWLSRIDVHFGYRLNPDTKRTEFHTGVDIRATAGTVIKAGHNGTAAMAGYDNTYGNYVLLDNGKGLQSKYAQCATLLVSAGQTVKKGDPIATVGNSGSEGAGKSPHLHLEVIKDGQFLNPLFFGETGSIGNSSPLFPDNPSSAMGDGSYQALIVEAEKHLGKPYVFGSSGPNTFDCSSFVCWVLDKSGVKPTGRTTAQGLYNSCIPVSPDTAQPGDLIFFQKTYSTPNTVTHVGIYVGNNQMIHCGKPVQYTRIDTPYWKEHFYAFGRIN